jgi:hypothetical protein
MKKKLLTATIDASTLPPIDTGRRLSPIEKTGRYLAINSSKWIPSKAALNNFSNYESFSSGSLTPRSQHKAL